MPKLLISACEPRGGGVYLLETESGAVRKLTGVPTRGLTGGPDALYAAGAGGEMFSIDPVSLECRPITDLRLPGVHDLRWDGEHFLLVSSRANEVIRLDREMRPVDRLRIVERDEDVCHANCLHLEGGRQRLCVFTLSPGTRQEKRLSDVWRTHGKVLELDWRTGGYRVVFEPLSQPHSLVSHENRLLCCESFGSTVVELDLASGKKRVLFQGRGFIRGLAFGGGSAYVGVSRNRQGNLWQRLTRGAGSGAVLELDPKSWRLRRRFAIPTSQVYEILPLPES